MLSDATILAMATSFAAACGDQAPTSIQYVRGTRGELNESAIGGDRAAAPSVLIKATGTFTTRRPGIPGPGASPTADWTVIAMVINDETRRVTDRGFRQRPNDLSKFGTVVDLTAPR